MKILSVTPITDTAQMPIKKGTLKFLQDAHKEALADFIIGIIGSSYNALSFYVLWGCENSGSGLVYNISAGAIFVNGEVYTVNPASFTAGVGQVAVLSLVTTQYTTDADPVTFTDGSVNNVHNIRRLQILAGASGSGVVDFSAIVRYTFSISDAVAVETLRATTVESLIIAGVGLINSAWTNRNTVGDVTPSGGSGIVVNHCRLDYKVIGKTMFINYSIEVANTTMPTGLSVLIPGGNSYGGDIPILSFNTTITQGTIFQDKITAALLSGSPTIFLISIPPAAGLSDGSLFVVSGNLTFEIV